MKFKAISEFPSILPLFQPVASIYDWSGIANFDVFECELFAKKEIGGIIYYQAKIFNQKFPYAYFDSSDWEEIKETDHGNETCI